MITAAGTLLGFGVVLSWTFGREFTDGTITGLFALPLTRPVIALAKLAIYLAWAVVVATVLVVVLVLAGLALDLGPISADVLAALARQHVLTVLSACLAVPAAWAATLGRGLLPGIATTIGLIVTAQVMVIAGTGAWFPSPHPTLWALQPDAVSLTQLALATLVPVTSGAATVSAWRHLQLDR